jgi:hypothetical protein
MALGPTNSSPLIPLPGGDRGRASTPQIRDGTRAGEAQPNGGRTSAAQALAQGEDSRAELLDDTGFQNIVDQATDRARQSNPNAPRGTFIDILV